MKEELIKFLIENDDNEWDPVFTSKLHTLLDEFFDHYQPERSKREDSFDVRCMESESKGYFVTAQIAGTSDWIEMRCSEHCSNAVREVQ